ncbi:MAG: aldo/keto reductase [Planctomycetota bacterium]|jgi:aryl-alcohol dehydrogenase-like predicted oxidoreductase
MKTRKLGYTELELTTVGLGTWAMGGPWLFGWGPQDDGEAIDGILKALELDINWIDTAAIYGHGHSEELVGQALAHTSEKPFIATKCSLIWNEQKERIACLKAESIRNECHASLKRLGIDRIDLYQIHQSEPDEDIEQAWEEMAKLQEEGKLRYISVSNFSVEQIKRIQKIAPVAPLQPPYNMLRRGVEDELLGYCAENNIGVIVYSPMQRGLLTGKFSYERLKKLAPDDHRLQCVEFQDPQFSLIMEFVEQLKPIAERNSGTLAQLVISWVLRRPEVTAAIVGARRPEQIAETYSASDWELAQDDIEEIEELLHALQEKINASQ